MDEAPWVSTKQASEALEVSERTIRRWCTDGKLASRKQGKAYLVEPAAMEEMRRQTASPAGGMAGESGQKEEETPATPAVADAPAPASSVDNQPGLKEEGLLPQVSAAADTAQPARPLESQAQAEREKTDRAATERQIQREQMRGLEAKVRALERENGRLGTAIKNIKLTLVFRAMMAAGGLVLYDQWDGQQEMRQEIREEQARKSMEARVAKLEQTLVGKGRPADSSKVAPSQPGSPRTPIRKRF